MKRTRTKVCAEPGCPAILTDGNRLCLPHRREHEHQRGTRQQRGYDTNHDHLRAHYQARMDAGETFTCPRCHKPINPRAWDLGHDDHDRRKHTGPECIPCNRGTNRQDRQR